MFEVCSAWPPVDVPFQAAFLTEGLPIHRFRPDRRRLDVTVRAAPSSQGQVARGFRAGTMRLEPPGSVQRISDAQSFPATAPRPASEDAVQTPLHWGEIG